MLHLVFRLLYIGVALGAMGAIALAAMSTQFVSPARIAIYGIAPALVAAVAGLLAAATPRWQVLGLVYGLAVVVAVGAAEVVLQLQAHVGVGERHLVHRNAAMPNGPDGLILDGHVCPQAYLSAPFGLLHVEVNGRPILPLSGLPGRPYLATDGQPAPWPSDRFGFNNPDRVWETPATVLAIGDSFTFGADVAIGRGFVDRIRERFPETINLGCGGNGPLAALAGLVEYGPVASPRVIVWGYYEGNDLTKDVLAEAGFPGLAAYLSEHHHQDLPENVDAIHAALDRALRAMAEAIRARNTESQPKPFSWSDVATLTHLRTSLGLGLRTSVEALDLFERTVHRVREEAEALNASVVFVYIPAEQRYVHAIARLDADAYKAQVLERVAAAGFDIVDGDQLFGAEKTPRSLYRGHLTEAGYRRLGDAVADQVARTLRPD